LIAAKWLGTLVKTPKNLLEKKERDIYSENIREV